jgi:hypothetical protein
MVRKGWSYKEDRRLSELAGSGKNPEQRRQWIGHLISYGTGRYDSASRLNQKQLQGRSEIEVY